jgi:hypothetical protein
MTYFEILWERSLIFILFEVAFVHGHVNPMCTEANPTSVAALTAEKEWPQTETPSEMVRRRRFMGLVSPHEPW